MRTEIYIYRYIHTSIYIYTRSNKFFFCNLLVWLRFTQVYYVFCEGRREGERESLKAPNTMKWWDRNANYTDLIIIHCTHVLNYICTPQISTITMSIKEKKITLRKPSINPLESEACTLLFILTEYSTHWLAHDLISTVYVNMDHCWLWNKIWYGRINGRIVQN